MELTKEQIASILDDAKPSIIAGLRDQIKEQVRWEMSPVVTKMITEEVTAFMGAEIIPVIKQQLIESKDGLISVAIELSKAIAADLAASLAGTMKKKLENSYDRQKIFKALFD